MYKPLAIVLQVILVILLFTPVVSAANASSSAGAVPTYGMYNYAPGTVRYGGYPYGQYANPYANPYNTVYGGYYNNPYYSNYVNRYNYAYGGIRTPAYGAPQLIGGGLYGIPIGGTPYTFWRAPSGFYYPWAAGYAYNSYPIVVMPPNSNTPTQSQPPVSTVVSDLDSYLDKAKKEGKIDPADYTSLRQRAKDLLSKEQSLAYEEGGTIDPDQEAEIRRDIEGLSAEVTRRVRP